MTWQMYRHLDLRLALITVAHAQEDEDYSSRHDCFESLWL